jgi:hypothetical protein
MCVILLTFTITKIPRSTFKSLPAFQKLGCINFLSVLNTIPKLIPMKGLLFPCLTEFVAESVVSLLSMTIH